MSVLLRIWNLPGFVRWHWHRRKFNRQLRKSGWGRKP